jgi:pyruvate/2-oxoglutarate dehydrogenase complex dihydrolipoamide dehydrogenase (E3) component
MSSYDYDIGIIGGGAAGLTVASGAAQLGASTILIEAQSALGGDCLHYGCVPSKTLIKSASIYHQLTRLGDYGLPPVEPPTVDFAAVAARIRQVIATIQHHDSVERFNGLGVEVKFSQAQFEDDHVVNTDSGKISAAKWVIATGSSPSMPPIPGLADIEVLTNKEIFSLDHLPESLLIIGAGPIGIEMAQAFNRLGSKVTVLQRSPQILSREDEDLADALRTSLEDEGVQFYLGCSMLSASQSGGEKTVVIRCADDQQLSLSGSEILIAAGRAVNVDGLALEQAGVAYGERGIEVDKRLRTSTPHIFAAGDVVGGYQFTHAAGYEGGIVVTNAVMGLPRSVNYRWMPRCTYSAPELGSIGLSEKQAIAEGVPYDLYEELYRDNDRAQAEGQTAGKIKLLIDKRGRPLGVQILGHLGGELLAEWVAALNGGVKLSSLAGGIHPYPTLSEINKRVVGSIYSKKIFSDRVRTILRLIHRYRGKS